MIRITFFNPDEDEALEINDDGTSKTEEETD